MNKRTRKKWLKKQGLYINPKEMMNLDCNIAKYVLPRLKMYKKLQEKQQAQAEQEKVKVQKQTEQLQAEADAQIEITKAQADAEKAKIKTEADAENTRTKAKAQAEANKELSASITEDLIKMKEAEARLKHGWVTVKGANSTVVDATKK